MKSCVWNCAFACLFFGILQADAVFPSWISYQGRLLNDTNLYNGTAEIVLRLYDSAVGGVLLGSDSNTVSVVDGLYSVAMGDDAGCDLSAIPDSARVWIEVQINGTLLSPREPVGAVLYSRKAADVPGNVFWRTTGNTNVAPSAFLGTLDNQALDFRVDNTRVLRLEPNPYGPTVIGGSPANDANGAAGATILGGDLNTGNRMTFYSSRSTIAGGNENVIGDGSVFTSYAFIGGGRSNRVTRWAGVIGGGEENEVGGLNASVLGGSKNRADNLYAVVGGGHGNKAAGSENFIGGGENNLSSNNYAAVLGGRQNSAIEQGSAVLGGYHNTASGTNAIVLGGSGNIAGGSHSLAGGEDARAYHEGCFVWADRNGPALVSSQSNQFLIRATGGVGINTDVPAPHSLTVNGNVQASGAVKADSFAGDGADLTSLDGGQLSPGTVTIMALAPDAVTDAKVVDGSLSAADLAANSFWEMDGNTGTTAAMFLGTTDDQPLDLKAGNQRALRLEGAGAAPNVIGGHASNTTTPSGVIGATIGGGQSNRVAGSFATVSGGRANYATNLGATVPGGEGNRAAGDYSLAAGQNAWAGHKGAFVWADTQNAPFGSSKSNQFLIRAQNGLGLNVTNPLAELHVVGKTNMATIILAPDEASDGKDSQMLLAEDGDATYGVYLRYDGGSNELQILGKESIYLYGPHLIVERTSGRVGIGTQSPKTNLHVAGSVMVSEQFKYAAPRVVTRSIPAADLHAAQANPSDNITYINAGYLILSDGAMPREIDLISGLDLPENASITNLSLYYLDQENAADISLRAALQRTRKTPGLPLDANTVAEVPAFASSTAIGEIQKITTWNMMTNAVVNNSNYFYAVSVHASITNTGLFNFMGVMGLEVQYTTDRAGP